MELVDADLFRESACAVSWPRAYHAPERDMELLFGENACAVAYHAPEGEEPISTSQPSEPARLYRVPEDQRRANPDAYEPCLFFFGPYRFLLLDDDSKASIYPPSTLRLIEEGDHLKRWVTSTFSDTPQGERAPYVQDQLARYLQDQLARDVDRPLPLYAQVTQSQWKRMDRAPLANGIALDALAIVALMLCRPQIPGWLSTARLFINDAMLLENQIPLDLVQKAFIELNFGDEGRFETEVINEYAKWLNPFPKLTVKWNKTRCRDCLLGAIYDCLNPPPVPEKGEFKNDSMQFRSSPDDPYKYSGALLTASYLARCGIKCRPFPCKKPKAGSGNIGSGLLDANASFASIHFHEKDKVLELPTITVGDNTIRFLHNLIAYEATCRLPRQTFVISYCLIMDLLIDTAEDVEVLMKAKVIQNLLGSTEELAVAWNKLCTFVPYDSNSMNYIDRVIAKVQQHAGKRWRRWRAAFEETYWNDKPWLLVSIVAATILLVLTFLQTIYTIKN